MAPVLEALMRREIFSGKRLVLVCAGGYESRMGPHSSSTTVPLTEQVANPILPSDTASLTYSRRRKPGETAERLGVYQ